MSNCPSARTLPRWKGRHVCMVSASTVMMPSGASTALSPQRRSHLGRNFRADLTDRLRPEIDAVVGGDDGIAGGSAGLRNAP